MDNNQILLVQRHVLIVSVLYSLNGGQYSTPAAAQPIETRRRKVKSDVISRYLILRVIDTSIEGGGWLVFSL